MWDWFASLFNDVFIIQWADWFNGSSTIKPFFVVQTAASIFAIGDLIISTFFHLAFGRYGLKLSTRQLWVKPKEKGE